MKSHYWIRAQYTALTSEEAAEQVLAFCRRSNASGILLFTQSFDTEPGLLALDEVHKRAAHLRRIVPSFRNAGLEVHINVMSTLGHGAPTLNTVAALGFDPMVDHLGMASLGTPCPLDTRFLAYVAEVYGHMAQAGASTLWVDDDVRYGGHGTPGIGCFCPLHLERISALLGRPVTREEIVGRLDRDGPEPTDERVAWQTVNRDALLEMATVIRRAVQAVDPEIMLGLMTVGYLAHASEGRQTPLVLDALKPEGTRWLRPGPGFWNDERPLDVIAKVEDSFRQVVLAGPNVRPVSEVENYPYTRATKSLQMLRLELALNALAGFADQSLDLFDGLGGVQATDQGYDEFLAEEKPWLDAIAEATANMARRGIGLAASERVGVHLPVRWGLGEPTWSVVLARLGLPLGLPDAAPHFLSGPMADAVAPADLEEMARAGLVVDGPAAERLLRRGLGGLIGWKAVTRLTDCGYERLTDDPLNGEPPGRLLSWRHGAPTGGLFGGEPAGTSCRVISRMLNLAGADLGAGVAVTAMADGGRVAVLPWDLPPLWRFTNRVRQAQLAAVFAWAAGRPLPAVAGAAPNLYPIVWADADDSSRIIAVANLSFDAAVNLPVTLDTAPWALDILRDDGTWAMGNPIAHHEPLHMTVAPWDVAVVRLLRG